MCRLTRSLLVALWLAFIPAAQAQTTGLNHVWTIPGVINTNGLATMVLCTNSSDANQTIAVDVYGPTGAFVVGNSITVAPQSTVTFATSAVTNMSVDVNLGTGTVSKGHARVLTSGKGALCSAFNIDAIGGVPLANLTVAAKFKQKGD